MRNMFLKKLSFGPKNLLNVLGGQVFLARLSSFGHCQMCLCLSEFSGVSFPSFHR